MSGKADELRTKRRNGLYLVQVRSRTQRTKSGPKADGSEGSTRIPIRGKVQEDHARETAAMES